MRSYKQQKFNLLREESEGYAKLAVEVLASMGPPHRPDGSSAESARARMQRATNLVLKVESLIGQSHSQSQSRTTCQDHVLLERAALSLTRWPKSPCATHRQL